MWRLRSSSRARVRGTITNATPDHAQMIFDLFSEDDGAKDRLAQIVETTGLHRPEVAILSTNGKVLANSAFDDEQQAKLAALMFVMGYCTAVLDRRYPKQRMKFVKKYL